MTKSNAAKTLHNAHLATTEGFEEKPVIANNDPGQAPNKVEELRKRIRAARLETMMARRLENELTLDPLALEPAVEPVKSYSSSESITPQAKIDTKNSWARSQYRTDRRECEAFVQDMKEQASTILSLAERSSNFLDYLEKVEHELASNRSAEIELREKSRKLEHAEKQRNENISRIEKQSRQIEMLESMRQAASENFENAKLELDTLQLDCDRKTSKLNEYEVLTNRLERENASLSERYEATLHNLEKANEAAEDIREKMQQQDLLLSHTKSELDEMSNEGEQALNELSSLQVRYNELNKKSLENQGQHYSRINELEEMVRELSSQLEGATRERDESARELEAANNLLMLHEEMISKLSSEE